MTEWREASGRAEPDARALPPEIPLPWLLAMVMRNRRVVILGAGLGLGLALVAALLKPAYYTSTFSFLPQSSADQARGGLASIAGQFGIPVGALGGASQPPQLYADVLKTAEVLGPIASDTVRVDGGARVPVSDYFGVETANAALAQEYTMRLLRERVVSSSVASRTTGAVTVRVRTKSPGVSLQIAERLLAGLNEYNRVTRQSQAGEERRFTQARLESARAALRTAEDALQGFLSRNRGFSAPRLQFEEERLQREVTLQQQVVNGLAQQFEDARIREVRDTPVITVVERPRLPVLPDPRGRIRLLVLGLLFGTAAGIAWVLGREGWRRQQILSGQDPAYALPTAEWRRARETSSAG